MNSCVPFLVINTVVLNSVGVLKKALQHQPFLFVLYVSTSDLHTAYLKNYNINPEMKHNLPVTFGVGVFKAFQVPKLKGLGK